MNKVIQDVIDYIDNLPDEYDPGGALMTIQSKLLQAESSPLEQGVLEVAKQYFFLGFDVAIEGKIDSNTAWNKLQLTINNINK